MDVANEILDAIEIIVDKKIRENTAQIYFGVCKGVSGDSCVMSINSKNNTIHFYGSAPIVGLTYRVFVPNGNMSMAFAITGNDDRKGLYYSNPNLLDNWYFGNPVNQRGKTEYMAAGYTIDRWKALSSSMSVSVTDEGIVLKDTNGGGVPYIIFDQKSELQQSAALVGKQVTFSVLVKSITGALCLQNGSNKLDIKAAGLHTFTVNSYVGNSEHLIRIYNLSANTEAVIIAAKVELGSQQTLAHQDENGNWILNEIPDYGEQLRRCQRYFVNFNPYKQPWFAMPPAIASSDTQAYSSITLPVAMRAQPVLSYGGRIYLSQTGDIEVVDMAVSGSTFTGISIQLRYGVTSGLTAQSVYRVQGGNDSTSYIWLSADL